MKQDFDVDIVIPWVDGSDVNWLKEKNRYLPKDKRIDVDASANRYQDWDNLKYVFRSIENFVPWVNKVYFITCGQMPSWLNKDNKKLVVVNHKDYIPSEYLPTFSSHPIELNMHRIKGLSEHFIYMNDDLFFTRKVEKSDFFKNGLPKIVAMEKPKTVSSLVFDNIFMNNIRTLSTKFDKFEVKRKNKRKWYNIKYPVPFIMNKLYDYTAKSGWAGIYIDHLPAPFLKSMIEKCWIEFEPELKRTCESKFRSMFDVSQYLFTYFQLCTGNFEPDKLFRKGRFFSIDDNIKNNVDFLCDLIRNQKYKMICLNDDNVKNFEDTKDKINNALDSILPNKSTFEN